MPDALPCQRHLFDMPREVAYLNTAYMGPLPLESVEAGLAGARRKQRPWELTPAHFFDESETARTLFAELMRADAEGVAIVPSASYGVGVAAMNLPLRPGSTVVTLKDQFPSNVYPWRRAAAEAGAQVAAVDVSEGDPTEAVLAAIDARCAVAALPHALWTSGARLDLERIARRCRETGAGLALDLTQSAGALDLDLGAVRPDFAVAAAYKWLLGPYSVGFLWVAPERREGRPLEENWVVRAGAGDFARLIDYADRYMPGARRFDMGERANFALMPAALASLRLLLRWGPARVEATLGRMNARIADKAARLGLAAPAAARRAPHFLSLLLPEDAPEDLVERLAAERVHVSRRGRSLRVTPHLWCDEQDEDRLIEALRRML
jgi:selenocysteine lyase/cysteine desulfurase